MNEDTAFSLKMAAFIVAVGTGLVIAVYVTNSIGCDRGWRESGMRSRYTVMTGCQIEHSPGKWIPADNYREMP